MALNCEKKVFNNNTTILVLTSTVIQVFIYFFLFFSTDYSRWLNLFFLLLLCFVYNHLPGHTKTNLLLFFSIWHLWRVDNRKTMANMVMKIHKCITFNFTVEFIFFFFRSLYNLFGHDGIVIFFCEKKQKLWKWNMKTWLTGIILIININITGQPLLLRWK